jgi:hypothetical protein
MSTTTLNKAQKQLPINSDRALDIDIVTVANSSFNGAIWQPPKLSFYL